MARHKRRWSVIYEADVGSAREWCQIKLHTSCDVPAPFKQLKTTVVDGARSIFAPTVVVIDKYFEFLLNFFNSFSLVNCVFSMRIFSDKSRYVLSEVAI